MLPWRPQCNERRGSNTRLGVKVTSEVAVMLEMGWGVSKVVVEVKGWNVMQLGAASITTHPVKLVLIS